MENINDKIKKIDQEYQNRIQNIIKLVKKQDKLWDRKVHHTTNTSNIQARLPALPAPEPYKTNGKKTHLLD